MRLEEIVQLIKSLQEVDAVERFLFRDEIPAFSSPQNYAQYKEFVRGDHPEAELILIGGSGNWGYSFNPTKMFRPFSKKSDIDLVVVSLKDFHRVWEDMRDFHRSNWYRIGIKNQEALRRSGENVYSGFITPKWIPDFTSPLRIAYEEMSNKYSNESVGYRDVNIMYFKSRVELIDYYKRSFRKVRRSA